MHHPAVRRTYAHSTNNNSEVGVSYTVEDRSPESKVATITVRNPKKMNIVDSRILQDLIAVCIELAQIPSLRAVVLTGGTIAPGKSPAFIGGADIKEMHALASSSDARTFITKVHHACRALRDLPVPVIARIHGFCLGAGLEIMAACDLRIATESSIFGMPEVKVGIPSVVEAALLPGLLGMGRTRRLLYLAENISATEAEKWGLIEKLVPHDDDDEGALDKAVDEWVETLICMGPRAIRSQKRLMQKWESCTLDEGVEAGVEAFAEAYENGGREPREYMSKFLNRSK